MTGSVSLRVLLVYGALALVANLPGWPGDPSRLAACACGGNKDTIQTAWLLAWTPFALLHGHSLFSSDWINAPFGVNLAQNTGVPLLGVLTAPLTLAVSPVASENLLRWLAFPLSGFAMFAVLRRLVGDTPGAFVGGLVYGFSPYMVGQGSVHLDLSFVPLPPLILYVAYRAVADRTCNPLTWGALLGLLAVAQFYISTEILATTVLTGAVSCAVIALAHPRAVIKHVPRAAAALLVGTAILAGCTAHVVSLMTGGPLHYSGPAMGAKEIYNADLLGPVLPTSAQLVAPRHLVSIGSTLVGGLANVDENGSYLGLPLLVLLASIGVVCRKQKIVVFGLVMALVMFALSLGPRLQIDGTFHRLPFAMPFSLLAHVPLLDDLLPARLALYVTFFVALVLAEAVARARAAWARPDPGEATRSRFARRLVGVAAVALATASTIALLPAWPYRSITTEPNLAETPAAQHGIPRGAIVLTYPYAAPATDLPMLWQALDGMGFRLLGGYALRRGPTGAATPLPSALAPEDVEGMLIDPLAPVAVPIPKVPYLAPTSQSVRASTIVLRHSRGAPTGRAAVSGVVQNANPRTRSFFVVDHAEQLVEVTVTRRTRYVPSRRSPRPFDAVTRGEHVAVYGRVGAGTITARRVRDLRRFIRLHDVAAVLVELGRHDSAEVVHWVTLAIGPPDRSRGGGALWLGAQAKAARRKPVVRHQNAT